MYILKKIDNNFELFDNDKFISNNLDFSALSEEQQREIGWFDVEKLAKDEFCHISKNPPYTEIVPRQKMEGYTKGFQKAQQLLSDRRFTLEDISKAINFGYKKGMKVEADAHRDNNLFAEIDFDRNAFIQSLSKQSWNVELEMQTDWKPHTKLYMESIGDNLSDFIYQPQPKFVEGKVKILKLL